MRKYMCWLFGHSYICLFWHRWGFIQPDITYMVPGTDQGSMTTGWVCQHCGKQRFEQWNT